MNLNAVSVPFVIDIPNLQSSQVNLRDMTHPLEIVKELKSEEASESAFHPNAKTQETLRILNK